MANVPVTGAPDWQTALPWKSLSLFAGLTGTYVPGVTNLGILPSLAFSAIQLRFEPASGHGVVMVTWYADMAGTMTLGSDSWTVSAIFDLLVTLPAEGPYFQVSINNTGGTNLVATNFAMLSNVAVARPTYPVAQTLDYGGPVSIPASGTAQDTPGFYTKGKGHLRLVPADASGKIVVTLDVVNSSGSTLCTLIRAAAFTAEVNYEFAYPDQQLYLNFLNTSPTTAHSITYVLWCADDT